MQNYHFYVTCPKNMESLLHDELRQLGIDKLRQSVAGISFKGSLKDAYKVCLWSRVANRVLLRLNKFDVGSADDLYQGIAAIDWSAHLAVDGSFIVDFNGTSKILDNSHYAALKVKDAIVDQFREKYEDRPTIAKRYPKCRVNVHLERDIATVSIDLSGESLHQRGYRRGTGEAPLKENVAAAMLYRANWPAIAKQGGALLDPMCGSGTLLIEGVFMAADVAPGLYRTQFGFETWLQHEHATWQSLRQEAIQRREKGLDEFANRCVGYDLDTKMIAIAQKNVEAAGLDEHIILKPQGIKELQQPRATQFGLVISNPPYGERIGDKKTLDILYSDFGKQLKQHFADWHYAILLMDMKLKRQLDFNYEKKYALYNGALACTVLVK